MPCLDDFTKARQELETFYAVGGRAIVDCQPGFVGRDGQRLRQLSLATNVKIIASTGFHLQKYYPRDHWLFSADEDTVSALFTRELTQGLEETLLDGNPVLAGQIKVACPAQPGDWPVVLMAGAARAALATGAAIQVHTERGAGAEEILDFFQLAGLVPQRLILAHMDKRADFSLHKRLIKAGVLLEYDTFLREKYEPETHVWPLILELVDAGLEDGIAIASDLAYKQEWHAYGGSPGLGSLLTSTVARLRANGLDEAVIEKLSGGNITRRLIRVIE